MDREIIREEYNNAIRRYWEIINTFPIRLQEVMPFADTFLSSDYSKIYLNSDYVYLSIASAQRYDMLRSPASRLRHSTLGENP